MLGPKNWPFHTSEIMDTTHDVYIWIYTHSHTTFDSFIRSFVRSFVFSFFPSFLRSFVPSFLCLFVRLLACLLVHSVTHTLINSSSCTWYKHTQCNYIVLYIYICVGLQCAIYLGKLSWPNNSLTINACLCMGNQSYWACFWFGPGSITRTRSGFLWWTKQHLANHALLNQNEHHDTIKTIISMFQPLKMYHKPR
jgi:hypothetical protein